MHSSARRSSVPLERKREIAGLAEAVADARSPGLPVNPLAIAQSNSITVSFNAYGGVYDGMLEHRAGRFHIYCDLDRVERRDSPRARFTLAHELGHYYIDAHRLALAAGLAPSHPSICEYESENLVEQEADHFAANLLLPEDRFLKHARHSPAGLPAILGLAQTFGTSVTSTAIRCASLEIAPCAVIKWSPAGYSWKWLSEVTRVAGLRRTIEATSRVIPGSATERALTHQTVPPAGFFQTGSTVAAWFPTIAHGSWRDAILIEQAVPLGRFGALTLLYPDGGRFPWT